MSCLSSNLLKSQGEWPFTCWAPTPSSHCGREQEAALCCQVPCSVWAGRSTGELIILVTVGSAGTLPGGTGSVFFGKRCEMIDQHWKHLHMLQNCSLLSSISRILGSAVLLIDLPHACLYMKPEYANKILNTSAMASSTDGWGRFVVRKH